jgi:ATP/maltotriose-dependent transcriptional regulator MalT
VEAATAAIRRVRDEVREAYHLYRVLPAYVEILLAAGDLPAARVGADELIEASSAIDAPALRGTAHHARGAVLLAEGDAQRALVDLRSALSVWQELESPYEGARTRLLIGQACAAVGDLDTAHMEYDSARLVFEKLGAVPDLAGAEELLGVKPPTTAEGLTGREVEVLALIATGKTNREIGSDLVISEKTVARHVSNIFVKLGVTSRAAATAYAFKHDLA